MRKQDKDEESSEDEESELGVEVEEKPVKKRPDKEYDIYKICQVNKVLFSRKFNITSNVIEGHIRSLKFSKILEKLNKNLVQNLI